MRASRRNARFNVYQSEVKAWATGVNASNGSVNPQTAKHVSRYVRGCKHDTTWAKLLTGVILPFASDVFAGCFVPLIIPIGRTITNNNFIAADYSLSNGLDPGITNTTKRLSTNIPASVVFTNTSVQISAYQRLLRTQAQTLLAAYTSSSSHVAFFPDYEGVDYFEAFNDNYTTGGGVESSGPVIGLTSGCRNGTTNNIYRNGNLAATTSGTAGTFPAANVEIFRINGSNIEYYRNVCSFIYFGQVLTDLEERHHYNRVQALQTALGRNV